MTVDAAIRMAVQILTLALERDWPMPEGTPKRWTIQ
jgi:hypothetical protein